MRLAPAVGLCCVLVGQAAAASLDDADKKAAYCLGRAEFAEQMAEGFSAAGTVSLRDQAVAALVKKRADALRNFLRAKGVQVSDGSEADLARSQGDRDQTACTMSRIARHGAENPDACQLQPSCDALADTLAQ